MLFSIALCFFVLKHHHIHFCPINKSNILMTDLRDFFLLVSKSVWVRLPMSSVCQEHNFQKPRLEGSATSGKSEMPRNLFQEALKQICISSQDKELLVACLKGLHDHYLQYKKMKKKNLKDLGNTNKNKTRTIN